MKVIYYYVLYLRSKNNSDEIEIHLKPFNTKVAAEEYKEKTDKEFGSRVYYSKIKKMDIAKYDGGIWL